LVTAYKDAEDWILRAETTDLGDYERFNMLCLGNGKVAFQTFHTTDGKNRYVTATDDGKGWLLFTLTTDRLAWEEFIVFDPGSNQPLPCVRVFGRLSQGESQVALQTFHTVWKKNRFVTAKSEADRWKLVAETLDLTDEARFTLVPISLP
jgi:hypothetical protein